MNSYLFIPYPFHDGERVKYTYNGKKNKGIINVARFEEARQAAKNAKDVLPLEPLPHLQSLTFDEYIHAGVTHDLSTRRKDRLIRRKNWQFGDRDEFLAFLPMPTQQSLSTPAPASPSLHQKA